MTSWFSTVHQTIFDAGQVLLRARWTDVVDMLVVAVAIHGLITGLRRSRSRYLSLGLGALALGYLVARWLRLTLTLRAFHAAMAIAAVGLIILFQEEIRRNLERLVMGRVGGREQSSSAASRDADIIARSVWKLAKAKTGALLLLPGRDPLARHLDGGTRLDGILSEPLLLSLFDPHSPGHDGAVVISAGRARCFGAHLPLSRRVDSDAPFGTRHTAAIGMSERADALLIVVSEERGTVHVAQGGDLSPSESEQALQEELRRHWQRLGAERSPTQGLPKALAARVSSYLVSALSAVALWVTVVGPGRTVFVHTYSVPVVLRSVPPRLVFDPPRPTSVRLTLSGPREAFRHLDSSALQVVVPVESFPPGIHRVSVATTEIDLPEGITLHGAAPRNIAIVAHDTVEKTLPVKAVLSNGPPGGKTTKVVRVTPGNVRVWLPKSLVGKITKLNTEPIDPTKFGSATNVKRRLELPSSVRLMAGQPEVVTVTLTRR